jgi:hypothetical protein
MTSTGHRESIRRHSGWWFPGAILLALLLLSGLLLSWYLRPGPRAGSAPTEQARLVSLTLHGVSFSIPANAIEDAKSRAGGERDAVTVAVLFPAWRGYSADTAALFRANAPDSALVRLSLHGGPDALSPRDRLERLYRLQIAGNEPASFGLTRHVFGAQSAWPDQDLFSGEAGNKMFLFLCERGSPEFPSPNCIALDRPLASGLNYSYRFKRSYLGRWQELSEGVDRLIAKYRQS